LGYQSLNFRRPVGLGDVLTVSVTVTQKKDGNRVVLDCKAINQAGEAVIDGVAEVVAPVEKSHSPASICRRLRCWIEVATIGVSSK